MSTATATALNPQKPETATFLNLMIVDDERAVREACGEVARTLGYNPLAADSAEDIYGLLESHAIDVVLLDLQLPGTGGMEALRKIKQRWPDTEVIVVTGFGTVQSAVKAMKNGAYDYITKPFSMDELRILLERLSTHLKLKSENRILRERIMKAMLAYGPGSARELENCLERDCALNGRPEIQLTDLPNVMTGGNAHVTINQNGSAKIILLSELERQTILGTVLQLKGDKLLAARLLGISKNTLYRRLKEYESLVC
jgi:DNA-binding NtrC family response regulator